MESKIGDNIDNNMIAQNLGTNQIFLPKNSMPSIPLAQPPVQQVQQQAAQNNVPVQTAVPVQTPVATNQLPVSNNYFNIFGIELSKNTLYIIVAFLILVCVYYYYFKSLKRVKTEKKSKKKSKKAKVEESSEDSE